MIDKIEIRGNLVSIFIVKEVNTLYVKAIIVYNVRGKGDEDNVSIISIINHNCDCILFYFTILFWYKNLFFRIIFLNNKRSNASSFICQL